MFAARAGKARKKGFGLRARNETEFREKTVPNARRAPDPGHDSYMKGKVTFKGDTRTDVAARAWNSSQKMLALRENIPRHDRAPVKREFLTKDECLRQGEPKRLARGRGIIP